MFFTWLCTVSGLIASSAAISGSGPPFGERSQDLPLPAGERRPPVGMVAAAHQAVDQPGKVGRRAARARRRSPRGRRRSGSGHARAGAHHRLLPPAPWRPCRVRPGRWPPARGCARSRPGSAPTTSAPRPSSRSRSTSTRSASPSSNAASASGASGTGPRTWTGPSRGQGQDQSLREPRAFVHHQEHGCPRSSPHFHRHRWGPPEAAECHLSRTRDTGGMSDRPANRLADRDQPLPAAARAQPGGLVPVGTGGAGTPRASATCPIFLSIGYAACHWCHVMERESFEDEATAALMNAALRLDQGRPGGAPRPRRHLHGRRAGDDGPRRMADVGVPHARRPAVLRRHVLPARAASRDALVPPGADGDRRSMG